MAEEMPSTNAARCITVEEPQCDTVSDGGRETDLLGAGHQVGDQTPGELWGLKKLEVALSEQTHHVKKHKTLPGRCLEISWFSLNLTL